MGFLEKLGLGLKKSSTKISDGIHEIFGKRKLDTATLDELEELLLLSDIGVSATNEIMQNFAKIKQEKDISDADIRAFLAQDIAKILKPCEQSLDFYCSNSPYVVLMVGVNGGGKTTTIGKLAQKLKKQGKKVSFIAADTFRAAAVEQLAQWAKRCDVRIFSGQNGCDAAGLCYDGLKTAIQNHDDVVFIDTAGRLQNKAGLMDELKKIVRVIQKVMPQAPHKILLTIDATTGQNAISQVQVFQQIVGVNGLIVTKLDGSAKGGVMVAIAKETALPIYYIGVGEKTEDLDVFNAEDYAKSLLEIN